MVLKKLNKGNYSDLSLYRLIALLNIIGKVLKAIIVGRISKLVERHYLLLDT